MKFNAEEVLAMAERIEADGAAFYRQAAKRKAILGRSIVSFLQDLAAMEDQHKEKFAAMRERIAKTGGQVLDVDPYLQAILHLDAVADAHGGEGDSAERLTGRDTPESIIETAIGMEQKSVAFYVGIREMVPPRLGRGIVDGIIAEEKQHVVTLTNMLRNVSRK